MRNSRDCYRMELGYEASNQVDLSHYCITSFEVCNEIDVAVFYLHFVIVMQV